MPSIPVSSNALKERYARTTLERCGIEAMYKDSVCAKLALTIVSDNITSYVLGFENQEDMRERVISQLKFNADFLADIYEIASKIVR